MRIVCLHAYKSRLISRRKTQHILSRKNLANMACYLTTGRSILQEYWLSSFFVVGLKTYRYDGVDYTEMKRPENGVTTAFVEGYVLISITLLHELCFLLKAIFLNCFK